MRELRDPISRDLSAWFAEHQREMPWRGSRDAYAIWVSEIMLQQTQVATVIPYFERFMAQFPTPGALAAAPEAQVLKAWEGLGYYSRARHLQAAAQMVVAHHEGRLPATWDEVRRLPGVGDYTAGAILSIAHGQAVPAVDGNVMRVISRLYLIQDDVMKPATKRAITALAARLLVGAEPAVLNQALMELGATICVPLRPACDRCPVSAHCRAFAAGVQAELPVKAKKPAPREVTLAALVVEHADRLLLVRRPSDGIWGGMWALPTAEPIEGESPPAALERSLAAAGLGVTVTGHIQTVRHTLTHRQMAIPVYQGLYGHGQLAESEAAWISPGELASYPLPVPFQKILQSRDPGPLFRTPL